MPELTSIQIQALVRNMDASMRKHRLTKRVDKEKFRAKVAAENEILYNTFPTIFEMHIEGKLDGTFFEMLKLKHKIEKGEITEDEASKMVGQKLFDRYVAPVIGDAPPPEKPLSYSDYYKQFEPTPDS
jgi:hypothetical protein